MTERWLIRNTLFSSRTQREKDSLADFSLWGILNCSCESFFDGNSVPSDLLQYGIQRSLKMLEEGADVIDVGGMSTKPGSKSISPQIELSRIESICHYLISQRAEKHFYLSIDTSSSFVAAKMLSAGVDIINDVSGFSNSPDLPDILADYRPGYVLTYFSNNIDNFSCYVNQLDCMLDFFEKKMKILTDSGLPEENIILDPGIGFGKNAFESLSILQNISILHKFSRPILLGVSNKSFIGEILSLGLSERTEATNILTALMYQKRIYHHRVHDVAGARQALLLAKLFTNGVL